MSTDAFTDLARGLVDFCAALRGLLNKNRLPSADSPAGTEARGEPFAGEWGPAPSAAVFATVVLHSWSCVDHLAATASVLRAKTAVTAPYTLIRAATEAAALASYIADPLVAARERLRRNMNRHLEGLGEDINLLTPFAGTEAAAKVARHRGQIAAISRGADEHGFQFTPMKKFRLAYLDSPQPSAMTLMDACASQTPGLGAAYQRHLSSVAHSQLHGLSQFLMQGPDGLQANVAADQLARSLFAGPICAATMVERLCWFAGWNLEPIEAPAIQMMVIWTRVAGGPQYPGPQRGPALPAGFAGRTTS